MDRGFLALLLSRIDHHFRGAQRVYVENVVCFDGVACVDFDCASAGWYGYEFAVSGPLCVDLGAWGGDF